MVIEYTYGCWIYAWIANSVHRCISKAQHKCGRRPCPYRMVCHVFAIKSNFGIAVKISEFWYNAIVQLTIIEGSYRWFYTTTGIVESAIVWGIRFIGTNLRLRGCHRPVGTDTRNCFSTGLFHKLSYSGWVISNARNPR